MASKNGQFKKYNDMHKRAEKRAKALDRALLKSKRKKKTHKHSTNKKEKVNASTSANDCFIAICIIVAVIVIGAICKFLNFIGWEVIIGVIIVGMIAFFGIKYWLDKIEKEYLDYLRSLLEKIDECQFVINNSNSEADVKKSLDELISIMDEIINAEEEDLRKVGMTKSSMESQKAFVLENYQTVIEQAKER